MKLRAPDLVTTERLIGHRVNGGDLEYLVEMDSDKRVQEALSGRTQTRAESCERLGRWARMWDEHGFGFWVFCDASGQAVGHGGVFPSPREPVEVEVGYALKPACWGFGYATEIAIVSIRVGFENLKLPRIIAIAQASNTQSRRIMDKCGMHFETEFVSPDGVLDVRYAIALNVRT